MRFKEVKGHWPLLKGKKKEQADVETASSGDQPVEDAEKKPIDNVAVPIREIGVRD